MHLLDANVLITAHNQYYPIDQVPQFWSWLRQKGLEGEIKIPTEIFEEIKDGGTNDEIDALYAWITDPENKAALLLNEEPGPALVQHVIEVGYGVGLTDDELEEIGRDPFLIAYVLADQANRCVVTTEVSRPSAKRQNRKVPDVCKDLGANCCNTFVMTKVLGFKTT
jgi:Domain of unknown function (DUF4411)